MMRFVGVPFVGSGVIGRTPGGHDIGAWILKARPDMWDIAGWLAGDEPAGSWRLADGPRVDLLAPGQRCFLWVTGTANARLTPGVWAAGVITGEVFVQAGDLDDPRWTDRVAQRQERPFVPLDLDRLTGPIPRAELRADPRFAMSEILRAPRVGNPVVVTPAELEVLDEWLE
jgi:EVE domain